MGRTPCIRQDLGSDLYLPLITRKIGTFVRSQLNSHNLDGAGHRWGNSHACLQCLVIYFYLPI